MNGSFTIFYIIGDVTGESGQEWSELPGFVGITYVFAAPKDACDHCGKQEEQAQLVTSTSPITSLLLDYVQIDKLKSMDAEDVKPFLIENLKWRAQTVSRVVSHIPFCIDADLINRRRWALSSIPGTWPVTTR